MGCACWYMMADARKLSAGARYKVLSTTVLDDDNDTHCKEGIQ